MSEAVNAGGRVKQMGLRSAAEEALRRLVEGDPSDGADAREFGRAVLERMRRQTPKSNGRKKSKAAPAQTA